MLSASGRLVVPSAQAISSSDSLATGPPALSISRRAIVVLPDPAFPSKTIFILFFRCSPEQRDSCCQKDTRIKWFNESIVANLNQDSLGFLFTAPAGLGQRCAIAVFIISSCLLFKEKANVLCKLFNG